MAAACVWLVERGASRWPTTRRRDGCACRSRLRSAALRSHVKLNLGAERVGENAITTRKEGKAQPTRDACASRPPRPGFVALSLSDFRCEKGRSSLCSLWVARAMHAFIPSPPSPHAHTSDRRRGRRAASAGCCCLLCPAPINEERTSINSQKILGSRHRRRPPHRVSQSPPRRPPHRHATTVTDWPTDSRTAYRPLPNPPTHPGNPLSSSSQAVKQACRKAARSW